MSLDEFNKVLRACDSADERKTFLQKFIFHGTPFIFKGQESDYFDFRQLIANKFDVGFQEVFIVGSAKLGFNYIKETEFNYESDIDVVIVSEKVFEYYAWLICEYQYNFDKFKKVITERELDMYNRFLRYMIKGWMRPDLLPLSFQSEEIKNEWFDFFKGISYGKSVAGNYKVAAGVFKTYKYLERYHINGIEDKYNKLF